MRKEINEINVPTKTGKSIPFLPFVIWVGLLRDKPFSVIRQAFLHPYSQNTFMDIDTQFDEK